MRTIKMTSISAGPEGVRLPGTVHVVPANEAASLIQGNHAVCIETREVTSEPPKRGKK